MGKFILSAFADEIGDSLDLQMDTLDVYQIKHIEMRGVDRKNVTEHSIEQMKEYKKRLDARGFALSAVGSPIGKYPIDKPFEPHFDLFKHTLEIACTMEAPYIRLFSFFMEDGEQDRYADAVTERMAAFTNEAKKCNIRLLHENEKGIYGDTPLRCKQIIEQTNSPYLQGIFDPANFVQCGVDTVEAFDIMEPYIEYMHIKDALYQSGEVQPAGFGDGRLPQILGRLKDAGFEGFLSLEPHLGNFSGAQALEKDGHFNDLPEGGPKLFGIAAEALIKILNEIGADYCG